MDQRRSRGRFPALLLALIVLMSAFVIPSAFGNENASADTTEAEEVAAEETTEEPVEEVVEEPVEPVIEEPVEEPVVEEPVEDPVLEEPVEEVTRGGGATSAGATEESLEAPSTEDDGEEGATRDSSGKISPMGVNDCVGGLNGELNNFSLELISRNFDGTNTTFTWRLVYNGTKEDCDEADYTFSNITITPCLAAIDGNYTTGDDPTAGTYKWNNPQATSVPFGTGDDLTLVFAGDVPGGGTASINAKKSDATNGQSTVSGPSCDVADCPNGYTLTTSVSPAGAGTISGEGTNPHAENTSVNLSAAPADGTWTFDEWTGDGTGAVTRNVSFTGADCELEVTANFEPVIIQQDCPDGYTLATSSSPPAGGTVEISSVSAVLGVGGTTYPEGTQIELTAVPNNDWDFIQWTGDGFGSDTRTVNLSGPDCDREVEAEFTEVLVLNPDPKDPKDPADPADPDDPAKRTPAVLSTRLPLTGSELITYLWLATLLMGVGAGVYGAARRRRETPGLATESDE